MLIESQASYLIAEIMSKFKSKRHFKEAYEKEGKIIVDIDYLSWAYIGQILTGEKLVASNKDLKDFYLPPR